MDHQVTTASGSLPGRYAHFYKVACSTKKLYNTTKMSYGFYFRCQDICLNIFIKGDKLYLDLSFFSLLDGKENQ